MGRKCGCCLLAILMILVILVAGIYFGGMIAYQQLLEERVGISYNSALGLVFGLWGADEDNIITNAYGENDVADLEKSLKSALFVSEDSDFSITELIEGLMQGVTPETGEPVEVADIADNGDNIFIQLLQDLKFDFSSLEGYDGETKRQVEITDKQLGALMSEVVGKFVEDMKKGDDEIMDRALDSIGVRQATIEEGRVWQELSVNLVIEFDVEKLVVSYLPDGISWLAKALPQKIFFEVSLFPYDTTSLPTFKVNENDKNYTADIITVLDTLFADKAENPDKTFTEEFLGKLNDTVMNTFATLEEMVELKFVKSKMEMNPVNAMLVALGLETANVSDTDLLSMISYISCVDTTEIANMVWNAENAGRFFEEFKAKMPIDKNMELNADNFVDTMLSISDNINLDTMDYDMPLEEADVLMNYDALTNLVETMLKGENNEAAYVSATRINPVSFISETLAEGADNDIMSKIKIIKVFMPDIKDAEKEQLITVIASLPAKEVVESNLATEEDFIKNILDAMMPENIYVQVTGSTTNERYKSTVSVNGLDDEKTRRLLRVMSSILGVLGDEQSAEQLKYENIANEVMNKIRDGIEQMKGEGENAMPIEFSLTPDGMQLPSVYGLVTTKVNKDLAESEEKLTEEQVYETLRGVGSPDFNLKEEGKQDVSAIIINEPREVKPELTSTDVEIDAVNKKLKMNLTGEITDAYLANLIKNELEKDDSSQPSADNDVKFTFKQMIGYAVAKDQFGNNIPELLQRLISDHDKGNHMIITAGMELVGNSIFTKPIYLNVLYKMPSIDEEGQLVEGEVEKVFVNGMGEESLGVLQRMLKGLTGSDIDIMTKASEYVGDITGTSIEVEAASTIEHEAIGNKDVNLKILINIASLMTRMNISTAQQGTGIGAFECTFTRDDVMSGLEDIESALQNGSSPISKTRYLAA